MATMPVVWCTDPNSVNNKPTAFALHGIQLQGNVTEKQVLALRELINAASEGRLILPSDGTFLLLDSGISIESSIVKDGGGAGAKSQNNNEGNGNNNNANSNTANTNNTALNANNSQNPVTAAKHTTLNSALEPSTKPSTVATAKPSHLKSTYILMPVTTTAQKNAQLSALPAATLATTATATATNEQQQEQMSNSSSNTAITTAEPKFLLEPKYSTFPIPTPSPDDEILYEFLCCARCMNEMYASKYSATAGNPYRCRSSFSCSSNSSPICPRSATRRTQTQTQSILQRYLKTCGRSKCEKKVSEPQLDDPVYNIVNKYTRRYHRKHCHLAASSAATAATATSRNRPNHRHKFSMQSVKIFHNRSGVALSGSGSPNGSGCFGSGFSSKTKSSGETSAMEEKSRVMAVYATVNKKRMMTTTTTDLPAELKTEQSVASCCSGSDKTLIDFDEVEEALEAKNQLQVVNEEEEDEEEEEDANKQATNDLHNDNDDFNDKQRHVPTDTQSVAIGSRSTPAAALCQCNLRQICALNESKVSTAAALSVGSRQRKLGTVVGGLQDSLNCETLASGTVFNVVGGTIKTMNEFEQEQSKELKWSNNSHNCDSNNAPKAEPAAQEAEVRDLISFDDDEVAALIAPQQQCPAVELHDLPHSPPSPSPPRSNSSSRKTSFDSTCTISSMDSGFIEMQNKIENSLQNGGQLSLANLFEDPALTAANAAARQAPPTLDVGEKIARLNYKECLTQSRNRRKSYEEFKAMFAAAQATLSGGASKSGVEAQGAAAGANRRKSYQEFRSMFGAPTTESEKEMKKLADTNVAIGGTVATMTAASPAPIALESISEQEGAKSQQPQQLSPQLIDLYATQPVCEIDRLTEMETTPFDGTNSTTTAALRKNSDFLAQILDHKILAKEKEKAHIRRKSYEEFKRLVRECDSGSGKESGVAAATAASPFKRQNSRQRKSYASFLLMRRNSAKDTIKNAPVPLANDDDQSKPLDLQLQASSATTLPALSSTNTKSASYRRNFKIYDKLVYGTIYDIIQRKNDICNLTYQKYDKYMTYGTIYEILHRKSSQCSGDLAQQRKSLTAILERDGQASALDKKERSASNGDESNKVKKSGMIYDIIQKQQQQQEQLEKQQRETTDAAAATTTPVMASSTQTTTSSTAVRKYGTIYDILQGEKQDQQQHQSGEQQAKTTGKSKNRFVVRKIDEHEHLSPEANEAAKQSAKHGLTKSVDTREVPDAKPQEYSEPLKNKTTKPNKMRRLSNILHYKTSHHNSTAAASKGEKPSFEKLEEATASTESLTGNSKHSQAKRRIGVTNLIPLDSEELYSRIVAQKRAGPLSGQIVKSSSLDAISMSVAISPPATPSPPRPRRSLKQHHCLQQQSPQQHLKSEQKHHKKYSLDSCGELPRPNVCMENTQHLRRWSNQMPPKCNCIADDSTAADELSQLTFDEQFERCCGQKFESDCSCRTKATETCTHMEKVSNNGVSTTPPPPPPPPLPPHATIHHHHHNSSPTLANHCHCYPCPCMTSGNHSKHIGKNSLAVTGAASAAAATVSKKGKSRRLSEFTRGEFLNEKP